MKVIEELYYGNIDPFEHGVQHKSEQKQLCGYICRHGDALKAGLSDAQKSTSEISTAVNSEVQKMDGLVSDLNQRMTRFLIGTAVTSVLLSVLVCVVLWLSVV